MLNPPKGSTGSKLPQNKDTRKLTPKEWIAYNESIGNLRVPSQAVYPSFKDPNKSYDIPDNPNDHLPYITYTSDWPPRPTPINGSKPVQLGPNTNYNPNTGQYFNPVTQTEIQPIIEQYYKGGNVKGYAYGSNPYGVQPQVSGYTSPYTQQGQNTPQNQNNGGQGAKLAGAASSTGNILSWANQAAGAVQQGFNRDDQGYIYNDDQRALNEVITPTYKHVGNKIKEGDWGGAFKEQFLGAQYVRAAQNMLGNDKKDTKFNKFFGVGDDFRAAEKARLEEAKMEQDAAKKDRKLTEDSMLSEKMALRDMGITGLKDEYLKPLDFSAPQGLVNTAMQGYNQGAVNQFNDAKGANANEKVLNTGINYLKQLNPFKKANGGNVGYNKGGDIKGHGGPKDDAINAEIEEGAFIVPNENLELARIIRADMFPETNGQNASLRDKKETAVPVKLSNMEHKFTKEEKDEIIEELGEEMLEMLAPNAEDESEEMREGGLTQAKASKILHDGTIRGKSITDKQRKYFGAIASGEFKCGGMIKGYKNGGVVPEYANGTGKDGVDPDFVKKELAKIEAQRKADAKRMGEQQAQLKYDEAVRNLRAQIYKNLERQNADKKKYKSELDKYTAEYNAVKKSYDDYVKESDFELNRPESPSRAYIGTSDKPSAESVRKEREKLLKMLQEKESKLNEAKKNYDFASNESNYIKTGSKQKSTDLPSDFKPFSQGITQGIGTDTDLDSAKRLESDIKSTPVKKQVVKKKTPPAVDPYQTWVNSMRPGIQEFDPNEPQAAPFAQSVTQPVDQSPAQDQKIPYSGVDPNLAIYDRDMAARLAELEGQNQPSGQRSNVNWQDVAGGLINYGIPALQVGMGLRNLKKAGDRPVDQLDPDFLRSVSRSAGTTAETKARSEYGLDPATLAYLNQQNQLATRQAMANARNYSGGSAANALSLSGAALGDQFGRTLQTKVADAQAKEAKYGDYLNAQRYQDQLTGMKADMNRRLFTDNLNAWQQDTNTAGALINTGLTNAIDSYRADQRMKNYKQVMSQANNFNYNPYQ